MDDCRDTQAAIWLRDEKPSFVRMSIRWLATVGRLRYGRVGFIAAQTRRVGPSAPPNQTSRGL
jgi:hypothetical protein